MSLDNIFDKVAQQVGRPWIILMIITSVGLALISDFAVDAVNMAISIASLAISLMIVGKQDKAECRARVRDEALHAKIDELIKTSTDARNELIGLEEKPEEEVKKMKTVPD